MEPFTQNRVSQAAWPWPRAISPTARPAENLRRKALIQVAVMAVAAALLAIKFRHAAMVVGVLAIATLVLGLTAPRVYGTLDRALQAFGRWVGVALTWMLLVPFFFLVFAPGRLLLTLAGKDPMRRRFPSRDASLWVPYRPSNDPGHYTKQYR